MAVSRDIDAAIARAARRHGVDPALLAAIASAPAGADAPGPMWLMPVTLRRLGVADPTDVVQVIDAGARHLRGQIEAFGDDLALAVAAYHAGPDAVRRHGGVPPYSGTRAFVPMIMACLSENRAAGGPEGAISTTTDKEGR